MKQSFIKIHYLFNTQLASPSYLPLPLSPPSLAPAQKANKINLRLRRTENKSQRQRGPHLPARGVEGDGEVEWVRVGVEGGVYNCHVNVTFIMLFLWFTRRGNILQPKAAKKAWENERERVRKESLKKAVKKVKARRLNEFKCTYVQIS